MRGSSTCWQRPFWDHPEELASEIEAFITGVRRGPTIDRVLATVLFTDIVGSTERQAALGDLGWKSLVDEHHRIVRSALDAGAARRTTPRVTGSMRRSTDLRERSTARARSWTAFVTSVSRSEQVSIRVSAKGSRTSSAVWR